MRNDWNESVSHKEFEDLLGGLPLNLYAIPLKSSFLTHVLFSGLEEEKFEGSAKLPNIDI